MMDLDFRCTSSSDRAGLLGVWTGSGFTVNQANATKVDFTSLNGCGSTAVEREPTLTRLPHSAALRLGLVLGDARPRRLRFVLALPPRLLLGLVRQQLFGTAPPGEGAGP